MYGRPKQLRNTLSKDRQGFSLIVIVLIAIMVIVAIVLVAIFLMPTAFCFGVEYEKKDMGASWWYDDLNSDRHIQVANDFSTWCANSICRGSGESLKNIITQYYEEKSHGIDKDDYIWYICMIDKIEGGA